MVCVNPPTIIYTNHCVIVHLAFDSITDECYRTSIKTIINLKELWYVPMFIFDWKQGLAVCPKS